MKNYNTIRPGEVFDGDILRVKASLYDDSIITKKYSLHFVNTIKYYRVKRITNNGNATLTDTAGKISLINIYTNPDIIAAYRRTV